MRGAFLSMTRRASVAVSLARASVAADSSACASEPLVHSAHACTTSQLRIALVESFAETTKSLGR